MFGFSRVRKLDAYRVYIAISVIHAFGFMMIATINMVYQAQVVGLSPLQLVLVGTLLEVVCFIFEVPTGIVADLYSRRLSVIIGYAMIGLGFLIEGLFPYFGAILLCQLIWGIGVTFTSGAQEAWIVDEIGEARASKAFMRGSQAWSIGGLLGIGASGLIAATVGVNAPIVGGATLIMGLAGFLILFMPETGFKRTPKSEREGAITSAVKTLRGGARIVRGRPILRIMFLIVLFGGLYSEGIDRLSTPHLLDNFTLPAVGTLNPIVWFSILSAGGLIGSLALTEIVRRKLNMQNQRHILRVVFISDALLISGLLVFALTQNFYLAAAMWVITGTLRGAMSPVFSAWSNQHIDSDVRATTISMMWQMNAIGQIGGGPGIGLIGERFGIRAALVASTLLLSPVLYLYARAARLTHAQSKEFEPQRTQRIAEEQI